MSRSRAPSRRLLLAGLLGGLLWGLLPGCGEGGPPRDLWRASTIHQVQERGELVVALEAEFPPFEYVDPSGEVRGFDVDLAKEIGKVLRVPVRFKNVKWEGIVPELVSGRADLIVSGMTITPERALVVSFTRPYFETATVLLLSRTRAADVASMGDLDQDGRVVVTKLGTTGEQAARARFARARIVTYESENAAALEVAQGRADAFLYDLASIKAHHAQHPRTTFTLLDPVTHEPYAIACRKGDPETVAWLDLFLDHLRRTGRLENLYAQHGLERPRGDG